MDIIPFLPLKAAVIRSHLNERLSNIPLHLFLEVDSTNHYLKNLPLDTDTHICCAELQTQGRGRFGRNWHSPEGENIYLSCRQVINRSLSQLSTLSMITGMAVLTALKNCGIHQDIRIKWPNDLLWNDKKLCGILMEGIIVSETQVQMVTGIGINVNSDNTKQLLSNRAWCSLYDITGRQFDRNLLIAAIINTLMKFVEEFLEQGFSTFRQRWEQFDYFNGKEITLMQSGHSIHGQACGINDQGQLCLRDKTGHMHFLWSGDTTSRGADSS